MLTALRHPYFFCLAFGLLTFVSALYGDLPIKARGTLNGILTAKGPAWIEVKNDEGYQHRYLARWIGGSPARGGGYDPSILRKMDAIAVGNRVELTWHWNGHLRVDHLKLLRPSRKKGTVTGQVLDKGDKWIEITSPKFGTPFRYYARWMGGSPEHGGSYHEPTLAFLEGLEADDTVELTWTYDVRPRILFFGMGGEEGQEDVFVPFYEKRDRLRPQLPPSAPSNPFDSVSPSTPSNPFDRGDTSPFDQISPNASPGPSANPFDAPQPVPAPTANPFDATPAIAPMHGNPFSPKIPASPFDAQPVTPANPFDK